MKRTNALAEGAMATALFAVLLVITLYVPLIKILAVWVLPLPFVVYVIRNGLKSALPLVGAAFVLSFLVGGVYGLFGALVVVSGGIGVGWMYHRGRPAFHVLLAGSLAYTAGILAVFILTVVFLHYNIISESVQMLQSAIHQAEQMTTSLGENTESSKNRLDALKQSVDTIRYLAPLFFVMMGVGYALITQLIATPFLKRLRLGRFVEPWLPFREWHFPKNFLWYYLIILVIGFFLHFSTGSVWYIGYYNLFAVLQLVMLIQGFSFIFFFFHEKKIHTSVPILIATAVFLFAIVLGPLAEIIELLGIIDLGFDLRKRMRS